MTAFVDANVILYAVGRDSLWREPCARILRESAAADSILMSSAEVLQEVFHVLLRRGDPIQAQLAVNLASQCLHVAAVTGDDVLHAAAHTPAPSLQARDLLHLATMARLGVSRIISTDRAFDSVENVARLDPMDFKAWGDSVFTNI